jgi:hypothetical protein
VTQPEPQSCWKSPTPMSALAPKASTLPPSLPFGPVLALEQLLGTGGELDAGIMTCTGTFEAVSPATVIVAVTTGPHTYPSRDTRHSPNGLPLESIWGGKAEEMSLFSTEDTMRKPDEPVSTST